MALDQKGKKALTERDLKDLKRLEKVVADDLAQFIRVGMALSEILKRELWTATHDSFEAYCVEKFDMRKAHAYRLIAEAKAVKELSPIGDSLTPKNEAQARELTKAPKEKRDEVMKLVAAKLGTKPLTAKAIEEIVLEVKGAPPVQTPGKTANVKQRLSVEMPVFLEWLQTLKCLAEQNQTGDLLRLLNEAQQEQRIILNTPPVIEIK